MWPDGDADACYSVASINSSSLQGTSSNGECWADSVYSQSSKSLDDCDIDDYNNNMKKIEHVSDAEDSSTEPIRPKRKRAKPAVRRRKTQGMDLADNVQCAICGDKPTGIHFDVASCNGCKTFFRRTILTKRKYFCSKDGKCEFEKDFRCSCRACRFAKCVRMGMNPRVLELEQRQKSCAQKKIFPNCEVRASTRTVSLWTAADPFSGAHLIAHYFSYTLEKSFPAILNRDDNADDEYLLEIQPGPSGIDFFEHPTRSSETSNIMAEDEFKAMQILNSLFSRETTVRCLRTMDEIRVSFRKSLRQFLQESSIMGKKALGTDQSDPFKEETDQMYVLDPIEYWMVADLILVVEYAKGFEGFKELEEDEQLLLLYCTAGVVQTVTQAFYSFDTGSASIAFPDGIRAYNRFRDSHIGLEMERYCYESFSKPIELMRGLKMSTEEFSIFKALLLFSSDHVEFSPEGRSVIASTRIEYTSTLRKIQEKSYGAISGAEKFAKSLLAISSFVDIIEKRRNYMEVYDLMGILNLSNITKGVFLRQFDFDDVEDMYTEENAYI